MNEDSCARAAGAEDVHPQAPVHMRIPAAPVTPGGVEVSSIAAPSTDIGHFPLSAQDIVHLRDVLARIHKSTGQMPVAKAYVLNSTVGTLLGLEPSALGKGSNVVLIQSVQDCHGRCLFRVQEPSGRRSLGPEPTYGTFIEALLYSGIYLREVIDALREAHLAALAATPTNRGR